MYVMCAKAVLSSKGQLVIPKILRNKLGIHSGSELILRLKNENTLEILCLQNSISNFFGMGKNVVKDNSNTIDVDQLISEAVSENDKY